MPSSDYMHMNFPTLPEYSSVSSQICSFRHVVKARQKREMQADEARQLLGFPSGIHPTTSQIKAAYKRKAWETHPDRFPADEKSHAESKFKKISEAYSCLQDGARMQHPEHAMYARVVRTGVPKVYGGRSSALVKIPFFLLIFGTVGLGGLNAARAYKRQKEAYPSHNPFLP